MDDDMIGRKMLTAAVKERKAYLKAINVNISGHTKQKALQCTVKWRQWPHRNVSVQLSRFHLGLYSSKGYTTRTKSFIMQFSEQNVGFTHITVPKWTVWFTGWLYVLQSQKDPRPLLCPCVIIQSMFTLGESQTGSLSISILLVRNSAAQILLPAPILLSDPLNETHRSAGCRVTPRSEGSGV